MNPSLDYPNPPWYVTINQQSITAKCAYNIEQSDSGWIRQWMDEKDK